MIVCSAIRMEAFFCDHRRPFGRRRASRSPEAQSNDFRLSMCVQRTSVMKNLAMPCVSHKKAEIVKDAPCPRAFVRVLIHLEPSRERSRNESKFWIHYLSSTCCALLLNLVSNEEWMWIERCPRVLLGEDRFYIVREETIHCSWKEGSIRTERFMLA